MYLYTIFGKYVYWVFKDKLANGRDFDDCLSLPYKVVESRKNLILSIFIYHKS